MSASNHMIGKLLKNLSQKRIRCECLVRLVDE